MATSSPGSLTEPQGHSAAPAGRAAWTLRPATLLPLLTAALLALAAPGGPGGVLPLLTLVALLPWAVFVGSATRGWVLPVVVAGGVYFGAFSWSLRHVPGPGWVLIVLLGPFLYWLPTCWLFRRLRRMVSPTWALALAWTAVEWWRAHFLSVPYPHAQLCHALYGWPALLAGAAWWGETGMTLWCAAVSGLGAAAWECWAIGRPGRAALLRDALLVAAAWVAPFLMAPHKAGTVPGPAVSFLAVQPGVVQEQLLQQGAAQGIWRSLVNQTSGALRQERGRPDLIVWPESAWASSLRGDAREQQILEELARTFLGKNQGLLLGAQVDAPDAVTAGAMPRHRVVAALIESGGRKQPLQEKQYLAPFGECIPFLDSLPRGVQQMLLEFVGGLTGQRLLPSMVPGRPGLPLRLPGKGTPFAALLCFDNAFPEPFARAAQAGAEFFCVLSNEAWYAGGNELDQLEACTVLRALETGRPILRVTMDGVTCLVASDGSVAARLLADGQDRRVAGTLAGTLRPAQGQRLAVWLGPWLGPAVWVLSLALLLAGWRRRSA